MTYVDAPVGVFDSGLGGLTVVKQIKAELPQERILYVADQAHVPYGGRELAEVRGFALGICHALHAAGCKAIVMACNISSATALAHAHGEFPDIPILGVIGPGVRAAAAQTRNGRIGVLATAGTVKSEAYTRALKAHRTDLFALEVACPQFVPLVEAGELETPEAVKAAIEYLAPICEADADTVILGCTHYPFLLPTLKRIAPNLTFIDPAEAAVAALARALAKQKITAKEPPATPDLLTTTGELTVFANQLRHFLPDTKAQTAAAFWTTEGLHLP